MRSRCMPVHGPGPLYCFLLTFIHRNCEHLRHIRRITGQERQNGRATSNDDIDSRSKSFSEELRPRYSWLETPLTSKHAAEKFGQGLSKGSESPEARDPSRSKREYHGPPRKYAAFSEAFDPLAPRVALVTRRATEDGGSRLEMSTSTVRVPWCGLVIGPAGAPTSTSC